MKNKKAIYKKLHKYGEDILKAESFQRSRKYVQHGTFSVWKHSLNVAETSIRLSRVLPFRFSERELVRGLCSMIISNMTGIKKSRDTGNQRIL